LWLRLSATEVPFARRDNHLHASLVPLRSMFSTEIFLPRGHAYLWTPWLVIAELATNALLAGALFIIGLRLWRRVRSGETADLTRATAWAAVLCLVLGATHVLDVWVTWSPVYGIDMMVRGFAALVALVAAFAV
jgi:two-component system, NtrC family, sensor kinase